MQGSTVGAWLAANSGSGREDVPRGEAREGAAGGMCMDLLRLVGRIRAVGGHVRGAILQCTRRVVADAPYGRAGRMLGILGGRGRGLRGADEIHRHPRCLAKDLGGEALALLGVCGAVAKEGPGSEAGAVTVDLAAVPHEVVEGVDVRLGEGRLEHLLDGGRAAARRVGSVGDGLDSRLWLEELENGEERPQRAKVDQKVESRENNAHSHAHPARGIKGTSARCC